MLAAFREEYLRSVSWGGDPARPAHIDPNTGVLSPRQSFAAWRQTVTGCSRPWEDLALGFLTALSEGLSGSTLGDTPLTGARARLTADMRVVSDDLVYREELGNVVMNVAMDGIAIAVLAESENIVRIVSGNRAFTRLFDLDPEECRGTPISALTARLGLKTPWQSLPGEAEIVLWSETHGPRNIALMRRSVLDTVIDGARKIWEIRVFQDVTRIRRREEALSVAFERALGEARGKSEFLANISHELRTPLNAVLGYAEIIAGQMLGPGHSKYSEYATDIHSAGAHLLALIDRLLTVSEIEAEKRVLRETRFDLGELAAECAAWVAEQPGIPKPPIVVSLPRGAVWIIADAVAMHQVAINLIGNAAKFTPASGHVDVTVTLDPANAPVLSVKDDGPGVAQELIGELFQPFRQGEGVYSRRHGGVGLGLSIVKGLVQLHGGVVRMTSQPGQGAEFIVRLPPSRRA
jgi:signal transduction histidine kinase